MTQLLDDIIARLEAMEDGDREELVKQAVGATQHMKWIPNSGPQLEAYYSLADILLFGGQAAGGKTDLSLGLAFTAHRRSLIMRRKYTNLTGLTARAIKINGTRKGFNGSPPPSLTTDDGRFIQFGANQRLGDEEDWQGIPFDLKCVGAGTKVLMHDGSYCAIERVAVGDFVQTLEGPRRVTHLHRKRAPAILATAQIRGHVVGDQIQGATHKVLTPAGWVSADSEPTGHRAPEALDQLSMMTGRRSPQHRPFFASDLQQQQESLESTRHPADSFAASDCVAAIGRRFVGKCDKCFRALNQFLLRFREFLRLDRAPWRERDQSRLAKDVFAPLWIWLRLPHPNLRPQGTYAFSDAFEISLPKEFHDADKSAGLSLWTSEVLWPTCSHKCEGRWPQRLSALCRVGYRCMLGSGVYAPQSNQESGCVASAGSSLKGAQQPSGIVHREQQLHRFSLSVPLVARPTAVRDEPSVLFCPSPQDYQGGCCGDSDQYDGQPRSGKEVVLFCPQQLGGAVERNPRNSQDDDAGHIRECSQPLRSYRHPYTKETRLTGASVCVASMHFSNVGEQELYDLTVEGANHYITSGGFINKNCFDEATQLLEQQIRFHIGWLRDAENPEQRTRAVLATNPPIDASGDWVIGMFRPWLDLTHPNPAEHGALRWFITVEDGDNVQDIEIDEIDLGRDDNGNRFVQRDGKDYQAMSRTFIPSTLDDNPYLARTNYRAQLDSLPEPIRSAVRDGNFMAARSDAEFQVIPTQWVIEAQNRWTPDGWKQFQMTCIAVDPAGGGKDAEEVCARHGPWFGEPTTNRGPETANSQSAMTTIGMQRTDGCPVIVDVGGGYGDKIVQRLDDNSIPYVKFNNAGQGIGKALNTNLKFYNKRAQAHWRLREALDPDRPGGSEICLPPGPEVRADLTAVTYDPEEIDRNFTIKLESKQKLKERIGRSPGKGDVIVMAHAEGQEVVKRGVRNSSSMSRQTHAKVGHSKRKLKRRRS